MVERMNTKEIKNILKKLILEDADNPEEAFAQLKKLLKNHKPSSTLKLTRAPVKSVKKIRKADNEYVYDIGMRNDDHPWFFANNMLVHNSVYFSAYPVIKQEIESGKLEWNKDKCVELYDHLCAQADSTFGKFMQKAFHCPGKRADVIKAGREIVASSGLFITKKRYAALVYDDEGIRKDVDGKPGKVKAMGLDLRRSDTPTYMQKFLMEILLKTLTNNDTNEIIERITEFRNEFKAMPGWEKGTPKKANKVYYYKALEDRKGKANMPGHVRASINWNSLKKMHGDRYSEEIVDGMKVIVCKLKPNPLGYTSVAYPVDQLRLPEWFKELPFDEDAMADTIIDNKLKNLIGVLDFDFSATKQDNTFTSFFDID